MKHLLAAVLLLAATAASAQTFLEPPRYVVSVWEGGVTADGLWFTLDGELPSTGSRLVVIDRLPAGVTIEATPGDLRFSAALAAHLGLRVGVPTLFEIGRIQPPALVEPAPRIDAFDPATDYAHGHARVTELLQELRTAAAETVTAGYETAPTTPPPAPLAPAPVDVPPLDAGGLVAVDPRAWP